jgi:hypothetical protein
MTDKFIDNFFIWNFLSKCSCAIFIISSLNSHVVCTNREHLRISKSIMEKFWFYCRIKKRLLHNFAPLCNSRPWHRAYRRHRSPFPCYATEREMLLIFYVNSVVHKRVKTDANISTLILYYHIVRPVILEPAYGRSELCSSINTILYKNYINKK